MLLNIKLKIITFSMFLLPGLLISQDFKKQPLLTATENLEKFTSEYSQQKAYLHTDKDEYVAGENIWLKAYLVDATTHLFDTVSTNLTVELVNIDGKPVSIKLLRLDNGTSKAEISLPDSLPEGNYQIRAYTDWMTNFDTDLFFEKEIFIHNPIEENFIRLFWDVLGNRRFNRQLERKTGDMQFAFFPEGGNIVQGLENRVAFKAANVLGAGQDITGRLFDDDDNLILEFESLHKGMGVFSFTPEEGKDYYAEVKFEDGQQKNVDLPDILNVGHLLIADAVNDKVDVKIKSNIDPEKHLFDSGVYLMAHVRGKPYFTKKANIEDGKFKTSISTDKLPLGVCHITLFNSNLVPIAERLVFIDDNGIDKATVNFEEIEVDDTKGISAELFFESIKQENIRGNYSVSVIGSDESLDYNPVKNIATHLLLTSDLGENIEDPWYYFSEPNTEDEMDLIMMTHGWRRFDLQNILAKDYPEIVRDKSKGITIRGEVSAIASEWKPGMQRVRLATIKQDKPLETYSTLTDSDGNFAFKELDYEGLFTAEISVDRDARHRTLDIDLAERYFYEKDFSKSFLTRPLRVVSRGEDWERVSRPKTFMETKRPARPRRESRSQYGTPDQVIYMEDIRANYTNIMQVLRGHVRGLRVQEGVITLRGISSIETSNEPLFLIDGSPVYRNNFFSINPNDVSRIEVYTGTSTSMFGIRGTNGAIMAVTKRADSGRPAYAKYILKGYTQPSEFYHSKIDIKKNHQTGVPRTIFWEPDLTPDKNGYANLKFPLDYDWNNIKIIIEGIDDKGNITLKTHDLKN